MVMETKIIAFDPGGTTGISMTSLQDHAPECEPALPVFRAAQLGPKEHHVEVEDLLEREFLGVGRRFVVVERFDYRNTSRAGLRLDSREYIGTIKGWARRRGIPVVLQSAAQAKGFVSDNILKELNLYTKAYRHANDAMRHMVYFAINNPDFKFSALPYELEFRAILLDLGFRK